MHWKAMSFSVDTLYSKKKEFLKFINDYVSRIPTDTGIAFQTKLDIDVSNLLLLY